MCCQSKFKNLDTHTNMLSKLLGNCYYEFVDESHTIAH